MENFDEKACLCALNRIFGYEPRLGMELISGLGCAKEVFNLNSNDLDHLLGPYSKYRGLICQKAKDRELFELEALSSKGISFCGWSEDVYPQLLKECEDPPIGLYIRSQTPLDELWRPQCRIAVVGTRDISSYGREWCERIVSTLSETDARPVIVSGLALGTDIIAHKTAVENGLQTIAVMATGPDEVYPYRHRLFAQTIASTPGCALITDYPPGTAPIALNFLRRNRIIAGLCQATILVESKIKGGGMMTSRLAYSYNREVYALPGRVDDLRSQGCNDLIRKKIAEPITSEKDLLGSLGISISRASAAVGLEGRLAGIYTGRIPADRLEIMKTILVAIRNIRGITLEEISLATGIDFRTVAELTGRMEIDGMIHIDLLKRCSINHKNV